VNAPAGVHAEAPQTGDLLRTTPSPPSQAPDG
jgi:hypothetical protein